MRIEKQYFMASSSDLVTALKRELKAAQVTYAELARRLGLAESSVKRMFSRGDMSLQRVDQICHALKLDFSDLAQRVVDSQPLLQSLSREQEQAVVTDPRLLLVAICVMSQWSLQQIVSTYEIDEAGCIACLARLDRLGVIELRPLNRYRLKLAKTFRWLPHGPVMNYFRDAVMADYFGGGFDGPAEGLMLVHGSIGRGSAPLFVERMQRLAADFVQQHQSDRRMRDKDREGYTLILAIREWEFGAFQAMRRRT